MYLNVDGTSPPENSLGQVQHYKNYTEMKEEKDNLCNDFFTATLKIWDDGQKRKTITTFVDLPCSYSKSK